MLPDRGDYSLAGSSSYGDLITDLPFKVQNKTIEGQLGEGEYRVKIEGNSDLTIQSNPAVSTPDIVTQEAEDTAEDLEQTTEDGANSQDDSTEVP